MKVPLSWLKEYVTIKASSPEIADILTMTGLEVDAIEKYHPPFSGIVVGTVTDVEPHPNADKLCIPTVSDGTESTQVVCGATNCRKGLKVAFAKTGASIQEADGTTFKIKKSKLRGVESCGMLCSGKELQLSDDGDGIIELPNDIPDGTDLAEYLSDTVLDISLTPNLGHCTSIIGVARELAAISGKTLKYPSFSVKEGTEDIENTATVSVENTELCPRYSCRVIKNVKISQSPLWLQRKLAHCGIRSINNIVDATNYVLIEYGHPIHAFDYDKIEGHKIVVRSAARDEKFITLDNVERNLPNGSLLICDNEKPIAIAGIMGGKNSEVGNATTNVLLESAYFDPSSIRRTSKSLALQTEASRRFERGTDPNNAPIALDRLSAMITELAGGEMAKGIIDIKDKPFKERNILCRFSRINKILGTQLAVNEIYTIFTNLGFAFTWDNSDTFDVSVPTYRNDITGEIDLIEEVARIYGYNNIPKSSALFSSSKIPDAPIFLFERTIREKLLAEGLQEFISCDLISPALAEIMEGNGITAESVVKVINPTSVEQSILRTSLLGGLLQLIKHNLDHGTKDISGFEIGRIHFKDNGLYCEQSCASIVLTGKTHPYHLEDADTSVDFFDIKGIVENIISSLNIRDITFPASNLTTLHPGRQASIIVNGVDVGILGEIHPSIQSKIDMPQRVIFAEINLHNLFTTQQGTPQMSPIPAFPGSERDWTLTIEKDVPVQDIIDAITAVPSKLLKTISLITVYQSDKIGNDNKNITLRLLYRSDSKTISSKAVDYDHNKIIEETLKSLKKRM